MQLTEQDLHDIGIMDHIDAVLNHVNKTINGVGLPDNLSLELILAKMYYERQWPGASCP